MLMRLLCLAVLLFLSAPTLADDLAKRDWSMASLLDRNPPPVADVQKLVNSMIGSHWDMPLCSFRFISFGPDKSYRLLAALDENGRRSCKRLLVIDKKDGALKILHDWKVWMVDDIGRILFHLDDDRQPELIIAESWSKYETGRCIAIWQRIYQWQVDRFVDASTKYPQIYKQRLKQLLDRSTQKGDPSCDQMEMDRIERFLGNSNAGRDRALEWMKSPTANLRRKAASVFADINDADSRKNLAILKEDTDPLVAETAKLYMESAKP